MKYWQIIICDVPITIDIYIVVSIFLISFLIKKIADNLAELYLIRKGK